MQDTVNEEYIPSEKKPQKKKQKYNLINSGPYNKSEGHERMNQLKLSDPDGYLIEMNLMKDAHKVLVQNLDTKDRREGNPDTYAVDSMSNFINYNTVK